MSTHFLNNEYTYTVNKDYEFKPVVSVGSSDNYHLFFSRILRIAFNLLRRWSKSDVENPPSEQYLSEPCHT